jgi:signal transduction histidine kinase
MSNEKDNVFKIRPAGRHILTIGRDLIQDPYAAVVELVKNAYDADAEKVEVIFTKKNSEIEIVVSDNGHGMTRDVVTGKWMVPSTNDKQIRKESPKGRIMQGRKGIGRYASAILGGDLFLETVSSETAQKTTLFVQWKDFEIAEYLSDVEILIETEKTEENSGTKLTMNGGGAFLQEWDDKQFYNLKKELKKLMTPIEDTKKSKDSHFEIYLTIKNFGNVDVDHEKIEPFPLFDLFDYKINGFVESNGTGTLEYEMQKVRNSRPEKIAFDFLKPTNCGKVYFDIRVFDRDKDAIEDLIGRGLKDNSGNFIGKTEAKNLLNENNGIGVYRNGFRIRPLGDASFDWVELNKQRVQNPSLKIGSDQVVGIVSIESEENSGLIEKSARDGLKENPSYEALKDLTKAVIAVLEGKRFEYRSKAGINRKPLKIEQEFERLFSFETLKKNVQSSLTRGKVSQKTSSEILGAIDKQEKEQNAAAEALRETVAIYQGQATMGKIVNVIIHEGRKPLGFFKNEIPLFKKFCERYLKGDAKTLTSMYETADEISLNSQILVSLFKKIDPLAAGKRGNKKSEYLKKEIEHSFGVFKSQMTDVTWKVEISSGIDVQLSCWKQDIYSVFVNLVENSIYWMKEKKVKNKSITVSIVLNNEIIDHIDYRDTGPGIEKHLIDSEVIFEPEFSTKPDNGSGLGLSIAGEAARRFGFKLKAIFSETGAYFRLENIEAN